MVCFTGSVSTGRKVAANCAASMKACFLELGGKDAAVVDATADLDQASHLHPILQVPYQLSLDSVHWQAAKAVLWAGISNAGASCLSVERVYVEESVFDQFVAKLVEVAEGVPLGFPVSHHGSLGPIIFAPQAEVIASHLADAVKKGAKVLCGGQVEKLGGGLYCRPTVVVDVSHDMKLMKDETFGPILPVMPFKDTTEGIQLANASEFGLSGAVFSATEA